MPTYDYICDNCSHEFEEFESIKADPQTVCPECREPRLRRKIGAGAAIIFKGSGFYQTDYRSESYKQRAAADKPADSPSSKPAESPSSSSSSTATSSGLVQSQAMGSTSPAASRRTDAAAMSSSVWLRALIATRAPSRAKASAAARPMPDPAPVTSADLPSSILVMASVSRP